MPVLNVCSVRYSISYDLDANEAEAETGSRDRYFVSVQEKTLYEWIVVEKELVEAKEMRGIM